VCSQDTEVALAAQFAAETLTFKVRVPHQGEIRLRRLSGRPPVALDKESIFGTVPAQRPTAARMRRPPRTQRLKVSGPAAPQEDPAVSGSAEGCVGTCSRSRICAARGMIGGRVLVTGRRRPGPGMSMGRPAP